MLSQYLRLLLLLLLFQTISQAQPYYFRHYQVENGLSNNSVFCSVQDRNGFMWFGTKEGLNRFDGYRFKDFNTSIDNEAASAEGFIASLLLDKQGVLWVGAQRGLYWFDEKKEALQTFIDTLTDINDLYFDNQGTLWFTSIFTLYRYDFHEKKLTNFPPHQFFEITSICAGDNGNIFLSTTDGHLEELDPRTNHFKTYDLFNHSPFAASRWIQKIAKGSNDIIYVGTSSQGLKEFNTQSKTYKDLLTYNSDHTTIYVRYILQQSPNEYWFATESGLFILDTQTGKFDNIRKRYLNPYSLSDNAVYTLYKDREGGIWAGTYFGGLNYYSRKYSAFEKYFPDYSRHTISGSAVREIVQDGFKNIWIGTEDAGLNKLDQATGKFTFFEPTGSATDIAYTNIHGLLVSGPDLWIGTFEHGLDIMDIKTGRVTHHYIAGPGPDNLKSNFIVTFLKTKTGDIYIGTSNLLYKYLPGKDAFETVGPPEPGLFVSALMEDHTGTIWAGTGRGLYYFNPATKAKGLFENIPKNKNSLTVNAVNSLFEDSAYNIWIATEGGGLCKLNSQRNEFQRFTTGNGLPSNFVFKVLGDDDKMIWATTSKGLARIDPAQNNITIFTKDNGLLNDQFNYNSGLKDSSGKLYFGSVRGMITFRPSDFQTTSFVPPLYITGVQVNNKELQSGNNPANALKESIVFTRKITLPYARSSISIDFAALSFASPEVTEYSYKMDGVDKDWTYIKSNRKAYYTNLSPGKYTFNVKAAINGVWSKHPTTLSFVILPPFYATWWAYTIYALLAASLLFYLLRTYHNRQTNKKEKEIYEAKIDFFTNIAHEIKTPLTLIKGPVENLSEMVDIYPAIKPDVTMMDRNTKRLVNLTNQILDFRQTEAKGFSLDFSNVNMNALLQENFVTFEPLAVKKKLDYGLELPETTVYAMADDEALNKVFSNLISNAVKYAESYVHVRFLSPNKNDTSLTIEFINDGFLVPADLREKIFEPFVRLKETVKQKGTGIGLTLSRSLMELHKGKIFIRDTEERLNVFVLVLPLNSSGKNIKQETSIEAPA